MTVTPLPRWEVDLPEDLRGGDPAAFGVTLTGLTLRGKTPVTVDLPRAGVTALVGGNNVGKSTLLSEIGSELYADPTSDPFSYQLLDRLHLERRGSAADLMAWLGAHGRYTLQVGTPHFAPGVGATATPAQPARAVAAMWQTAQASPYSDRLGGWLTTTLLLTATPERRLDMSKPAAARGNIEQPAEHPLHVLQQDRRLLRKLSDLSMEVFREPLTLDWLGGDVVLRVGIPAVKVPRANAVTAKYHAALVALPPLERQGDGMRSLLGLMLPLVAGAHPLVLVDEPEAFLHPPQAAALGRTLGRIVSDRQLQLVLATHDKNILAGLIASKTPLTIVRLDRPASGPSVAHQLDADRVRALAADPVLRYTNALDGLFHRLVVLAESSDDCAFYSAALDAADERRPTPVRPSEVLFVPCSGKSGMPRLANALRQLHIPVVATTDLDVLNDKTLLEALVEALHPGAWATLLSDYKLATEPLRQPREQLTATDIKDRIVPVLDATPRAPYTGQLRNRAKTVVDSGGSRFQELKNYGLAAVQGQARQAADRLVAALDEIGVVVVQHGELERFAPSLGVRKSAGWLPAALEAGAHESRRARKHVRRLVTSPARP